MPQLITIKYLLMKFAIAALVGLVAATPMSDIEFKFVNYVAKYGKSYGTKEEYEFRLNIFAKKTEEIARINASQTDSVHGYNKLTDWTDAEYKRLLGGRLDTTEVSAEQAPVTNAIPDWTTGWNWVN